MYFIINNKKLKDMEGKDALADFHYFLNLTLQGSKLF